VWNIAGKTVFVSGATSGIGLEAAAVLASQGAHVILAGRDPSRVEKARAVVRAHSGAEPSSYVCDFADLSAVRRLADEVLRDVPVLHVLINNAGSVFAKRTLTVDGIEATFAVNHLSHFLLTQQLLSRLVESGPSRVITVASGRHFKGTMDFADIGFERGYQILRAYARSKLANVLFASELARRLAGTQVTSNSVHPGRVATNIWSGAPRWTQPLVTYWLSRSFISVKEGAAPIVALATRPDLADVSGRYFDRLTEASPSLLARDLDLATRLWHESERLACALSTRG
jgi:NAD(P)-dependent dehydrogenase (short-subunit alcohol dehydrogenase family)